LTPPAALFFYSPDRKGEHPRIHLKDFRGIIHADGYARFNELFAGQSGTPSLAVQYGAHRFRPRRQFPALGGAAHAQAGTETRTDDRVSRTSLPPAPTASKNYGAEKRNSGSHVTRRRWREMDSNCRYRGAERWISAAKPRTIPEFVRLTAGANRIRTRGPAAMDSATE
jgi:hypothetical protein